MKLLKKIISKLRGEQDLEMLIKRGLVVGSNFKRMSQCIIDPSHCWHIKIGNNVTLAPKVHILAHDTSTKTFLDYTKVGNVTIGNNVFIGAGTIILPNTTIEDNVIIGAGSIVTKSISKNSVAVGNPAKIICSLDEYLAKEKTKMNDSNCFDDSYTLRNKSLSTNMKENLIKSCKESEIIYIK